MEDRDHLSGYYYPRKHFRDDIYLLNTNPLVVTMLDIASIHYYTSPMDIEALSFDALMSLMGIENTEPFVAVFPVFKKRWPLRREELDSSLTGAVVRHKTRVENGRKGGRPKETKPVDEKPKPKPLPLPTGTDPLSDLFSLAQSIWPSNRIETDDIYALVDTLKEVPADQMRVHILAYGKWLETKGDDFLQVMKFSNWLKTGDYERWKTKATPKPKPQVSDDLESTPRTGMRPKPPEPVDDEPTLGEEELKRVWDGY